MRFSRSFWEQYSQAAGMKVPEEVEFADPAPPEPAPRPRPVERKPQWLLNADDWERRPPPRRRRRPEPTPSSSEWPPVGSMRAVWEALDDYRLTKDW
jgi:hypothetical protein